MDVTPCTNWSKGELQKKITTPQPGHPKQQAPPPNSCATRGQVGWHLARLVKKRQRTRRSPSQQILCHDDGSPLTNLCSQQVQISLLMLQHFLTLACDDGSFYVRLLQEFCYYIVNHGKSFDLNNWMEIIKEKVIQCNPPLFHYKQGV